MSETKDQTAVVNGMEMHYRVRGDGYPLLLLHGFTGAGSDWDCVFKAPPPGYRLLIPDLRGHGRSTNPLQEFTHRQAASDMISLLNLLDIGEFKAVGLSAGAKTLLHMATRDGSRASAMVLVSGTHYFPDEARSIMARMTVESRTDADWQTMRQRHSRGDEQILALWRQANAFKDSYDDMNLTPQELSRIRARVLVVHGDRDPFYPVDIPVAIYRAIPQSRLWIIPNAGHAPIFGELTGSGVPTAAFAEAAMAFLND